MSIQVSKGDVQPQGPGEDPIFYYTKLFARFLQVYFATFEKGGYQWTDDLATTDIVIQGGGTVAREVVEKRPAIIVARGPTAFGNIAIDQFKSYEYGAARRNHTDLMSSSVTYMCLSKSGVEAGRLAWTAAYITRVKKRTLTRAGLHRVGEDLQLGAEGSPGEFVPANPREIICVPVSVPFYFQQSWSTEPIDKVLLKEIDVTVRSEAAYPAPGATVIKEPGRTGRVLSYSKLVSLNSGIKATSLIAPRSRPK